jgi:hypothetical protein
VDAVKDVPYEVGRTLVDFDINSCAVVVGRALPEVARWDAMGFNGRQCVATEQN